MPNLEETYARWELYKQQVSRTVPAALLNPDEAPQLHNMVLMGTIGEFGEVVDTVKKHLHQGHVLVAADVIEELGDLMWYATVGFNTSNRPHTHSEEKNSLAPTLGLPAGARFSSPILKECLRRISMGDTLYLISWMADVAAAVGSDLVTVMDVNHVKLSKRYSEGFSTEESQAR